MHANPTQATELQALCDEKEITYTRWWDEEHEVDCLKIARASGDTQAALDAALVRMGLTDTLNAGTGFYLMFVI